MYIEELTHRIPLPDGVTVSYEAPHLTVTGSRGSLTRNFGHAQIDFEVRDCVACITGRRLRRREKALLGTWRAHLTNMVTGVSLGFRYSLKIIYSHFPMKVSQRGNRIVIDNFLGEKAPRFAPVQGDVDVRIKGDAITIEGSDREHVGQTAANLERATVVKNRDRRVFQDGIYITAREVCHE